MSEPARRGPTPEPRRPPAGGGRSPSREPRTVASVLPDTRLSIVDLADRLLDRGVVLTGEAAVSVAGVDLIYLGLNVVLSGVAALERRDRASSGAPATRELVRPDDGAPVAVAAEDASDPPPLPPAAGSLAGQPWRPVAEAPRQRAVAGGEPPPLPDAELIHGILPGHVEAGSADAEHGLAKLVLALVELLRQLLERQAVRRMEGGSLSDEEIERVGVALMRLEEQVRELARSFGLQAEDLNVDLGPLGTLL